MITSPRSACPINRTLEMLGDQWSLVILRDIAVWNRRSFRQLLTHNAEGISAPVLSRRLTDLEAAGFISKTEVERGKRGRYSLTELGIQTVPLMVEMGKLGALIDPTTSEHGPERAVPEIETAPNAMLEELRRAHL